MTRPPASRRWAVRVQGADATGGATMARADLQRKRPRGVLRGEATQKNKKQNSPRNMVPEIAAAKSAGAAAGGSRPLQATSSTGSRGMQSGDGSALRTALLESGFRRADVVRIVTQCLHGMGYARAADVLEQDSGVKCLSEPIFRFREAILCGDWCDRTVSSARQSTPACPPIRFADRQTDPLAGATRTRLGLPSPLAPGRLWSRTWTSCS